MAGWGRADRATGPGEADPDSASVEGELAEVEVPAAEERVVAEAVGQERVEEAAEACGSPAECLAEALVGVEPVVAAEEEPGVAVEVREQELVAEEPGAAAEVQEQEPGVELV